MKMKFKLKTLTPIWTGGINRNCESIRETSILGSLRWWFEVIVRGFDYYACDPTSEHTSKHGKCTLSNKNITSICPVCQIFGCTGWSRRFRLEIEDDNTKKIEKGIIVKVRNNRGHKGWFLGNDNSGGILGEFSIKIRNDSNQYKDLIGLLFHVSALWGLGAKIQDGFGICKFNGSYDFNEAVSTIKKLEYNGNKENNPIWPNLKDFFFAEIIIEEDIEEAIKNALKNKLYVKDNKKPISVEEFLNYIPEEYQGKVYPTAPLIRDWLRGLFRKNGFSDDLRHFLIGFVSIKGNSTPICKKHLIHTTRENNKYRCEKCDKKLDKNECFEKIGSKIFVSHIYKFDNTWRFKIWGYIPKKLPNNVDREKVLKFLHKKIKEDKEFMSCLGISDLNKDKIGVKWYKVLERGYCDTVEKLLKKLVNG